MLFTITSWIIILTLLGIVGVCAFRLCCEATPEDSRQKYKENLKQQPPETNHYEPLNHQLKQIAAANQADGKQDSGISVTETALSETKATEIAVPEEKKPLNTEQEADAFQEVTVSVQSRSEIKRSVESSVVVLEQTLPASAGSAVNSTDNSGIASLPPVAKLVNVTTTVAPVAVVVDQSALHKSPPDNPLEPVAPLTADAIAAEPQPYNNEIPMPYVEVESATLPKLSNSNEAAAKIVMPSV